MSKKSKKQSLFIAILGALGAVAIIALGIWGISLNKPSASTLPLPEVSDGARGELGIDKNINEDNIDAYLGRPDAVYRDMRMLEDLADYESIGGDRYLSGFIKGFEVVPLPKLVNVSGLPEAVGETYSGPTLFTNQNGTYRANYAESLDILEYYFPKDKTIFLMCGGGGYAGMMKNLLVGLGWDETKIYNVGGYWYYHGENNVQVKRQAGSEVVYDFWKVSYHDIDFKTLGKKFALSSGEDVSSVYSGSLIKISAKQYEKAIKAKKSFILLVHMDSCPAELPLTDTVRRFASETGTKVYSLDQTEFEKTDLAKTIKYLPSAAIFEAGKLASFLDANSSSDLPAYKSADGFKTWVDKYVNL